MEQLEYRQVEPMEQLEYKQAVAIQAGLAMVVLLAGQVVRQVAEPVRRADTVVQLP